MHIGVLLLNVAVAFTASTIAVVPNVNCPDDIFVKRDLLPFVGYAPIPETTIVAEKLLVPFIFCVRAFVLSTYVASVKL